MKFTNHAKQRARQRGFNDFIIKTIFKYGISKPASGDAIRLFFGNNEHQKIVSELKKAIQLMDKAKGGNMIISEGRVLTVYKS